MDHEKWYKYWNHVKVKEILLRLLSSWNGNAKLIRRGIWGEDGGKIYSPWNFGSNK